MTPEFPGDLLLHLKAVTSRALHCVSGTADPLLRIPRLGLQPPGLDNVTWRGIDLMPVSPIGQEMDGLATVGFRSLVPRNERDS
jgi:hypothetical protein